jgi:hypothetical protein
MIKPIKDKQGKALDPNDPDLKKETDHIAVDIDVTEFDPTVQYFDNTQPLDKKTIKYLETCVRSSYEYRSYIEYLKSDLDITKIALMPQIDIKDIKVSLEFHHYPLTLYEIADIITNEMLKKAGPNGKISLFDVMEEITKEHYEGLVGLVPLTSTLHEMAHSQSLVIPFDCVYGNVDKFYIQHKDYMVPEYADKIITAKGVTEAMATTNNFDKLKRNTTDYKITYHDRKDVEEDDSEDDK